MRSPDTRRALFFTTPAAPETPERAAHAPPLHVAKRIIAAAPETTKPRTRNSPSHSLLDTVQRRFLVGFRHVRELLEG